MVHTGKRYISFIFSVILSLTLLAGFGGEAEGSNFTDYAQRGHGFSEINITVTRAELRSGDFKVTLFSGEKRKIDLLKLEPISFSLSSDVPAVKYKKIRLYVSDLELVKKDGTTIHQKLHGKGKLDLKPRPRRSFKVESGGTLSVQVVSDARKSIHIIKKRNRGKYLLRPVVFVNIQEDVEKGKEIRLHGQVKEIDTRKMRFELCSMVNDDSECVHVYASSTTEFFDINGRTSHFTNLVEDDSAAIRGYERIKTRSSYERHHYKDWDDDSSQMAIDAEVVEIGDIMNYEIIKGLIWYMADPTVISNRQFDIMEMEMDSPFLISPLNRICVTVPENADIRRVDLTVIDLTYLRHRQQVELHGNYDNTNTCVISGELFPLFKADKIRATPID